MAHTVGIHPVVLAPTFNNGRTLEEVLRRIDAAGLASMVIDDGCTDDSPRILQQWSQRQSGRTIVTHRQNRGKAAALLSGFAAATEAGFTHAITIDTDGQLDPAQIPQLLERAAAKPHCIVVGCRDAGAGDYPTASRLGRRASNLLIRWETGLALDDSQCGFRVYPLRLIEPLACGAGRFGFETEILTRAAWAGVEIEQIAVACRYELPGGRVSHFRPWRDSLAAVGMHVKLLVQSQSRRGRGAAGADATVGVIPATPMSGETGLI
jgi:glycosyltransferase involved in cell wall biosynthesis